MSQAAAPAHAPAQRSSARIDAVDWLRGFAVVLMIQTHVYGAWLSRDAMATPVYRWWSPFGGLPFRIFLLLVGVSMAIRFEAQLARGVERKVMVRGAVRRGFEIVVLAYLFRLQEYVLGGFWDWHDLFRVDILNCIGASMMLVGPISAPRGGRAQIVVTLLAAAVLIALGPIVGPAYFPAWLPRPLTSYIGGQRPMAHFTLVPQLAWALVGVVIGHWWVRESRTPGRLARAFILTGAGGLALIGAVKLVRTIDPYIIHYPSKMSWQLGPGLFFDFLGQIGVLALLAYLVTRVTAGRGFSPMRVLGQTSLLVYWVHVELCYGLLFKRLHGHLTLGQATVGFLLMTVAMLGLSVLRIKYWRGGRHAVDAIKRRFGNLPSSSGPL